MASARHVFDFEASEIVSGLGFRVLCVFLFYEFGLLPRLDALLSGTFPGSLREHHFWGESSSDPLELWASQVLRHTNAELEASSDIHPKLYRF